MLLIIFGILAILLIALLLLMSRIQEHDPIPNGHIIYDDLTKDTKTRTLYSKKYRISGKPDLILRRGFHFIPVEIKNMRAPEKAYEGHIAQLMAYCLLIEENFGKKPKYGILKYRDRTYEITYTISRKTSLISTINEMRGINDFEEVHRKHQAENRCIYCGFRDLCTENLCPQNER